MIHHVTAEESIDARIDNTRYYSRDVRRYNSYSQEILNHRQLANVSNLKEVTSKLEDARTPAFKRYDLVNILDDPNSGYT